MFGLQVLDIHKEDEMRRSKWRDREFSFSCTGSPGERLLLLSVVFVLVVLPSIGDGGQFSFENNLFLFISEENLSLVFAGEPKFKYLLDHFRRVII